MLPGAEMLLIAVAVPMPRTTVPGVETNGVEGCQCPVSDAHRRLMDCHAQWHATLDAYMDPDGFRLSLNSLVQNLRNVTWLLQKRKAELPGFSTWYPAWQTSVAKDPVMAWVVKARNRIVKEADLELYSSARVQASDDWLNNFESSFQVPARFRTREILNVFAQASASKDFKGTITVERRWVDRLLPNWELLAACEHAYSRLVPILRQAHLAGGVSDCNLPHRTRACINASLEDDHPSCLSIDTSDRVVHFDSLRKIEITQRNVRQDRNERVADQATQRYGRAVVIKGDAIERVQECFDMSKRVIEVDGYLLPSAMLLRGSKVCDLQYFVFDDQNTKRLAMVSMARRIERMEADGLVILNEVWWAMLKPEDDSASPTVIPARDRPDRKEAIQVLAITADGRRASRTAFFKRTDQGIVVGDEIDAKVPGTLNLLRPVFRVWGLDFPGEAR